MAYDNGFMCRLFSVKHREYLYAASQDPFDEDRRSIFTWKAGDSDSMCNWKLIPATHDYGTERKFYVYNDHQKEYLYAASQSPYDGERRHVFTWRRNQERDDMMLWRLEPTSKPGVFALYNPYQKEYLYAADFDYDSQRRRVFTWRPGVRCGSQGHWRVEWLGQNPLN
ncbi:uncharacterized protein LOC135499092 [Lineus longissimus]|uniref:uncharacterized protein LOC135499092 n=1 Tax=Lineus longissimus TaxID=88925 RepID=UPI00315DABEF